MAEKTFFRGFVPRYQIKKNLHDPDQYLNHQKKLIFVINENHKS